MIEIEEISDKISEKIDSAEMYAKCALMKKDTRPQLAESYFKIATDDLGHVNLLHTQIVAIIDEYRKTKGEPPEAMQTLYNILHRKQIERAAAVRGILALYKEI